MQEEEKVYLGTRELHDGTTFYFWSVGKLEHGREQFRIWVSPKLVKYDENGPHLVLPVQGVELVRTEKGTLKLVKGDKVLYNIYIPSGYRGESSVEPLVGEEDTVIKYNVFESPRGSLGVSEGCIIVTRKQKVTVRWERTGRTYGGAQYGILIVSSDGKEVMLENVEPEDLEELKEND